MKHDHAHHHAHAEPGKQTARDPVCGTYVVPSRALTSGEGADVRFFCSEKCRRAYQVKPAR